jgi:hypothetical protein
VSVCRILMPLTLTAMAAFCGQAAAQGAFPAPLPNQSQPANAAPAAASPFPAVNGAPAAPAQRPASASPFPSPSGASAAASQGVFTQGAAPVGGGLAAGAFGGGGGGPPPGAGGGSAEQQECLEKFAPLRNEAEKRAQAIKAASERKAPPQEACNLIKVYVVAEAKLVSYVTAKQTACGIPAEIPKTLKSNQARSQQMLKAVCQAAAQGQGGGGGPAAPPSLSEALGASGSGPEVRSVRSGGNTFDTINGNVLAR